MNRRYFNMTKRLLIILFSSIASLAFAQNYTALNGPYGGSPRKIVEAGAGTLLGIVPSNGVLKSTNGGSTWTASNTGLTNLNINDIIRDSGTGKLYAIGWSQLFTSTDNGTNWVLTANSGFANGYFIQKTSTFLYIVGTNSNVYRSSNDGVTWSQVNSFTGYPKDFEVNAAGGLFIVTEASGVYRSTNNGLNFDNLGSANGLTDIYHFSMTISGTTLYLLGNTTVNKSTNNGDTWTSAKGGILNSFNWNSLIEKDPAGNIIIFDLNGFWKTSNGGVLWTPITSPILSGTLLSPYFESATTFYIGLDQTALYKTTNGGTSWAPLFSPGITANSPQDLVMTDNGRLLYAKGYPFGFYMSIDDGATWDFINSGITARDIRGFTKVGSTIFAHGNGIIKTTNNGGAWSDVVPINTASYYYYNLLSNDGTNLVSITTEWNGTNYVWQLKKSSNGGVNWTSQNITGLPSADCSYISEYNEDLVLDGSGNLYALIYEYCSQNKPLLYQIAVSTGVATEITGQVPTVTGSVIIQDIELNGGKFYVFTSNSRIHATTDGANWITKNTTTTNGNIKIIDANTFYILNNSVFLSTDAGTTWVNTGSPGTTNKYNRQLVVSATNYSYVAQDYGLVYKSNAPVIPPVAPTGLVSTGRDRNSIGMLFNDNSSNENYFIIEASVGNNQNYDSVASTTRPTSWSRAQGSFLLSAINGAALSNNTTYFLRIRAAGAGGKSAPSNEISVTTLVDCTATSAVPLNRSWTATTLNTSGVGVQTQINQTVTGGSGNYALQNLPLGAGTGLSPTPPNPWSVSIEENCGSVFVGTTTQYLSNGNGTWDPVAKTITIPWQTHPQYPLRTETTVYTLNASDPIPDAPATLTAAVFLPGTVLLNWTNSTFTTTFELERSTSSGSGFTKIADIAFPTISYKDLDPALVIGTTYYYRVRAKNSTGASAYSPEASIIPRSNYLFLPFDNLPAKTFSRTGGGGAWGDIDGDGINDLVLGLTSDSTGLNLAAPIVFKSVGNGQFSKLVIPELAAEVRVARSVNIIDVNNDGRNDIFLSRSTGNFDLLLIKNSDGSYQKVEFTEYAQGGLPSASWADYDNDGFIDLLANTALGNGSASDKILFKNNGDGTFTRITEGELVTDFGATRETQWADYDNDGDQDVLVLNQTTSLAVQYQTRLYKNNGDGTFTRVLGSAFEAVNYVDRSCSWGDYDNDGDLDVFITGSQNRLYRNNGDGTFTEMTSSVVAESQTTTNGSYGSAWADMDNDGDLDVFAMGFNTMLYYNNGDGTFTKYATPELFNAPGLAKLYGPALEDVDNDGFLDFHNGGFSNPDIPNVIYRNTTPASASRKWLKVKLTGTTSNRLGVGARITVIAGGKTQIREVQSHTAQATQSSPTQHFGLGNAATIVSITVKWPSGIEQALTDVNPNQTLTIIEDGDGPAVTSLLPADDAVDVPVNTTLEITFDEPPIAVAGKNLLIFLDAETTPTITRAVTTGTITGNKVVFTLSANLVAAKVYRVEVEAGAFRDLYSNLTEALEWSFETIDNVAPAITFAPPSSLAKGFSTTKFSATITDNSTTVSSATLNHRKVGGSAFTELTGIFNATEGKWEFTVQESMLDANGIEFFITSKDPSDNVGRLPATSNFQTSVQYTTDNSQITVLGIGGTSDSWKIFTIPFELGANNGVTTVFDELSNLEYKEAWRLLKYSSNGPSWLEYPGVSQLIRGQGYFINIKAPINVFIGNVIAPTNTRSNLFTINLSQGWNQIGNPYLTPINWSDVVAYNGLTGLAVTLKTFSSGNYANVSALQPFEGGFVFAESATTISIPFAGQTAPGGRKNTIEWGEGDWLMPLLLSQDGSVNDFGGVGMHKLASESVDEYDDLNAPRFLDFIEMTFDHPEHMVKKLARDVVPLASEYTWSFNVSANKGVASELSWRAELVENVPGDLMLFDVAKQRLVDMKERIGYSFNPGESSDFKIYYGEGLKDKLRPTAFYLSTPFPNPVQSESTIAFTLPETGNNHYVSLEVFNANGQRVATLVNGHYKSGFYRTIWNAEADPSGMYFVRLNIETGGAPITLTEKIVVNK